MTIEKVTQPEMLSEFRDRLNKIIVENQQLAAKIKENETTAYKLQGAIETLEYYNPESVSAPPEEAVEAVDEVTTEE
ncbi:hypothetical protein [Synechococcus phage S-H25]|nr:hypothetical protein [Synechococcus phage S-H25]